MSFFSFAGFGSSLLFDRMVPTKVVFFASNFLASGMLVKKLSVVIFQPRRKYGSANFNVTNSLNGIEHRVSSYPI